jgi:GntR family transcriptional regulator, transcriptional repressor for pyruvate dehydrogenase complex
MVPNFKLVENMSLPEAVAEQMMAMIADGRLKPGDRLPTEPELMELFGVGRSTVREASKSLALAGLIETRRSAGTYVSESYAGFLSDRLKWTLVFSSQDLQHIVEVRCALEGQTAALAAERATVEQQANLANLYRSLVQAQDPETATEADTAFHVLIAEASQNPLLLNLVLSTRSLIRNYIKFSYAKWGSYDDVDREENVFQHRPILEAIQTRKPDAARQTMLEHLNASARWMLAIEKERRRTD